MRAHGFAGGSYAVKLTLLLVGPSPREFTLKTQASRRYGYTGRGRLPLMLGSSRRSARRRERCNRRPT